jgi:hypothetical protein
MELLTTKQLCESLKISRSHLMKLVDNETLKIGEHYYDLRVAGSYQAMYRWDKEKVLKVFGVHPAFRQI